MSKMEKHEWLTDIEIERTRQLMRLFESDKPPELEAGDATMLRLLADLDAAKALLRECFAESLTYSVDSTDSDLLARIRAVPGVAGAVDEGS